MRWYEDLIEPEKMVFRRRVLRLFGVLNLLLVVIALSYAVSVWREWEAVGRERRPEISVPGEGKVTARPDIARIQATILTHHESLRLAQEENSRRSNTLAGYLTGRGVAEKDVKTVGYQIYPQYRYPRPCLGGSCPPEEAPTIIGYQVRSSFEITVRDIVKTGDILSGVVSAGVNEVNGVAFTIDDPEALRAEARKKAIENAREKAKVLARDLGRRLGRITAFSEGGSFPQPVPFAGQAAFGLGKGGGVAPPVILPGENEIVATVSITYELR